VRELEGKRVVLLGASSGIGAAAAERFGQAGARLVLVARGEEGLREAARRSLAAGSPEATLHVADLTDRAELAAALATARERLGGIDVLVLIAGAAAYGPFWTIPEEDADATLAILLRMPMDAIRLALPDLRASGGAIVATASVLATLPAGGLSVYVAGKHGLRGLLDTLRLDLRAARVDVAVCEVNPGPVATPFWHDVDATDGVIPPQPPGAYSADAVARAILHAAITRRDRTTVGGLWAGVVVTRALTRPLFDSAQVLYTRFTMEHGERDDGTDSLHRAASSTISARRGAGRRSALVALREKMRR